MKIGIIGLGSMGKRRIRNLKALGQTDIIGFDLREDRRLEAQTRYGIHVVSDLTELEKIDAAIISTPPDHHHEYLDWSLKYNKPCFVELNIVLQELSRINLEAKSKKIFIATSCTYMFHPAIQRLQALIASHVYGKVTGFIYHCGHYLPDWHPWEHVRDFFVSNPETSGCRELVVFELTWIRKVFGRPTKIQTSGKKTLDLGLNSNDTCGLQLMFPDYLGVMLVDVVSRFATRSLTVNLEKAQIRWNWEKNSLDIYSADTKEWHSENYQIAKSEAGYNENISETIYIEELRTFLDALNLKKSYPSSLDEDIDTMELLGTIDPKPGETN